ncbi:MAG: ATP-binding protein, partial [Actinomycetota bacterium]|nr:ATP-binding protein [Actinomycetota bacterium]
DVAFLALRTLALGPEGMRLEVPTDVASIRHSRHLLGRWLERVGASPEETREIQLAAHEACANAIEHAYRFGDDVVLLEAGLADGEVELRVSDNGGWHEGSDPLRGRGIELMRELMDRVTVDGGPQGTTVELRRRLDG